MHEYHGNEDPVEMYQVRLHYGRSHATGKLSPV